MRLLASRKLIGVVGHSVTSPFAKHLCPQQQNYSVMAANNINYNTRHLKKGDPLPPYNGKLRVYNMRYCPYAQRTILALNAKKIPYEVVNINLVEKPEWLPKVSPFGKVPSIEVSEGVTVFESLITVEYLDEKYPEKPLLPKDPYARAFDKIIIEATAPMHTLMFKLVRSPDAITEDNIAAFHQALAFVQEQLKTRGGPFLDGNEPGFADYMIWPWFERILVLKKYDKRADIDLPQYKLLNEYIQRMYKDVVVSDYLVPEDILKKFFDSYRIGQPDYSMMDE